MPRSNVVRATASSCHDAAFITARLADCMSAPAGMTPAVPVTATAPDEVAGSRGWQAPPQPGLPAVVGALVCGLEAVTAWLHAQVGALAAEPAGPADNEHRAESADWIVSVDAAAARPGASGDHPEGSAGPGGGRKGAARRAAASPAPQAGAGGGAVAILERQVLSMGGAAPGWRIRLTDDSPPVLAPALGPLTRKRRGRQGALTLGMPWHTSARPRDCADDSRH